MKYTAIVFILFLSLSVFGGIDLRANLITKQPDRLSLRHRQSEKSIGQMRIKRFDSSAENFTASLFAAPLKPLVRLILAGELDGSFGVGGKVTTQFAGSASEAFAIATQADGKLVLAGYSLGNSDMDFALVRYNGDGSPDTSFGVGGKVITNIGSADNAAFALAIQPADGKMIAAGNSFNGTNDDFALARYNSDGTLDATFGANGIVTTNFNNTFDYIDAVALQADGKIVAAGYTFNNSYFQFALARYNSNGALDDTFGTGGKVTTRFTSFDDLARAVTLQSDGKIIVAGEADNDFAVARYNSDGSLDTTFDGDGKVRTSLIMFDLAYDVGIDGDGKIVVVGEAGSSSNADFALVRYNPDGSLDTTFDGDGKVATPVGGSNEIAASLALQTDGKITVGGFSFNGTNDDFALARYNSNGSLDSSFGVGGKVTTNFSGASDDYISALTIQSGRILAVGSTNVNFAAAAYFLEANNCSYTLSPTSVAIVSGGGAGEFTITTDAGCSRTAVSNHSFVTITNGGTGTGSGTVSFTVAANTNVARTGTITVGNQTFTINQAAGKSRKRIRFI
jgi:uncharacterized delta-60 repeat protein